MDPASSPSSASVTSVSGVFTVVRSPPYGATQGGNGDNGGKEGNEEGVVTGSGLHFWMYIYIYTYN